MSESLLEIVKRAYEDNRCRCGGHVSVYGPFSPFSWKCNKCERCGLGYETRKGALDDAK